MRILFTLFMAFFFLGCSKTPTLSGINGIKQGESTYNGQITSISYERKSSLIEDFGAFVIGDTIGEQFGRGDAKDYLGIVGGVVASEIYEKNFADEYTKLEILANGKSYPIFIKGHLLLKLGRSVKISISDEKISGISLLSSIR